MNCAVLRYKDGKDRAVTFSYDDDSLLNIKLTDLMEKYNVKATLNLNSASLGAGGQLNREDVRKISDNSLFEIAAHGAHHPYFDKLPTHTAFEDIFNDRKNLEAVTDKFVRGMAYPFGSYNSDVCKILEYAGIVYSRTTRATGNFNLPDNWLEWHPTCHHKNSKDSAEKFLNLKVVANDSPLLYIWGHAHEFPGENSPFGWDDFEALLKTLSGKDNIWYATNIEIYNYVQAYKQLIYSADGKRVYNPTSTDIWIGVNANWNSFGTTVKIPAGETVNL